MDKKEKLKMLQKLDEKRLTKEFLIPLFESMDFRNVIYNHGVLEYGKDIIYCEDTKFLTQRYVGVQVKSGDIDTEIADKLFCQVARGLGKPFQDLSDNNKEKPIDEFKVLSSGEIKQNARDNISASLNAVHTDKPVSFIGGRGLVGLLDKYMPSAFWDEYDYFSKYFHAMKTDFETLKDVTAIGQKDPIPLERIYVSLRVSEKTKPLEIPREREERIYEEKLTKKEEELKKREREKPVEREKILDADRAVKDHDKLVIVGVPGSGKSTLLKHFALKACQENLEKQERTCVPIPITLWELLESRKSLRDYLDVVFDKYEFPEAKDFIEKDLEESKCRLLLDGFDELATKQSQEKVTGEIQKFVEKYPKSQVVVTSRIAGYHDELKGFTKLELMEFDDEQIKKFIENWFGRTEPDKASSMSAAIFENEQMKALARNPLMVAITAVIYEEDRQLPQKRADLYNRCVEVLLSRWDKQRRIVNKYPPEKKEFILRKLAFYGHCNNKRIMSEKEVTTEMLKYFPQIQLKKDEAKAFLDEIWQRSYLLRQISMDSYDFLHLSFQEYFTASELKERPDGLSIVTKHLLEPWWEEPILLYAGISRDASALIKRIEKEVPEDIFYSNLMLFGKCVADAEFTEPSLRDEILNKLWQLYQTSDFKSLPDKVMGVLSRIKPDSIIDSLINDLTAKESSVRARAAETLGSIGGEKAAGALIKALTTDKEGSVRFNAAFALESMGSEKAIGPLIEALTGDKDGDVRWMAAEVLGSIGSEKAVGPLIKTLTADKEGSVRFSAASALGRIGSNKAAGPLIETLTADKDGLVRWSAAEALGRIGSEKATGPLVRTLSTAKESDLRTSAAEGLGSIRSEKATGPLIEALTADKENSVRRSAAEALGRIGSEKAAGALIKALTTDEESEVRRSAASALGRIGSEKAAGALIKALTTDEESDFRRSAAEALGRIGSDKATGALIQALTTDEESDVRRSAASALGSIGSEKAVGLLTETLTRDKDSYVRGSAAEALGRIGSERAIEPLRRALSDEGDWLGREVKDAALGALEKICRQTRKRIPLKQSKN